MKYQFDIRKVAGNPHPRQTIKKIAPISFRSQPRVKDRDDPAIGFAAEGLVPAGDPPSALSLLRCLRYNQIVICIQVFRFPFWEEAHER